MLAVWHTVQFHPIRNDCHHILTANTAIHFCEPLVLCFGILFVVVDGQLAGLQGTGRGPVAGLVLCRIEAYIPHKLCLTSPQIHPIGNHHCISFACHLVEENVNSDCQNVKICANHREYMRNPYGHYGIYGITGVTYGQLSYLRLFTCSQYHVSRIRVLLRLIKLRRVGLQGSFTAYQITRG